MPITSSEYKWRDRILLLVGWGTILFSATVNWASDGLPVEVTANSVQNYWQSTRLYIYTVLPLVIFLFPLLIWLVSRRIPSTSLSNVVNQFQHSEVFWGLIFLFNLGLASLIYQRFRNSHLIEFLLISLGVVIILWFFYRRATFDIRKIIVAITLWATIILVRQTLYFFRDKIDFFNASCNKQVYILLMVITLIGSVFLPLIVLFDRRRRITSKAQKIFARVPIGIWAVVFIVASLWTFAFFWIMENEVVGIMAIRLGAVAITLSTGGMLLWVFNGEGRRDAEGLLSTKKTWYVIMLSLLLIVYVVLAFRIGANNLGNINPDGLSYLNIAREYAKGNPVVRGYWSPLISWLISPLIMLGVDPHVSYQVMNGLAGFAWILITLLLGRRAGQNYIARLALAATMIVIVLSFGLTQVTPDILGSLFIAVYFYWITSPAIEQKPVWIGIAIGLSGALAYLAKYYNFPFIMVHLFLTAFLFILHRRRIQKVAISTVVGICVMIICIAPWLIALYHRYGYFTITTSGQISRAVVGPNAIVKSLWSEQLCDQPMDVLFPWEDPQPKYYSSYGWSPFQSLENFRYQILLIKNNTWNWISSALFELGPLLPFAVLTTALAILIHWGNFKVRLRHILTLVTALLYIFGYMFTFSVAFRYYFAILPFLFIAGYSFLQKILEQAGEKLSNDKRIWLQSFMAILFAISILGLGKLDLIKYFLTKRNDPCLRDASLAVMEYLRAPIAGTDTISNYIAYYTQVRTLGVLPPDKTASEIDVLLREFGVQTYIISNDLDLEMTLVSQYFYSPLLDMQICGEGYTVLQVPD